MGEFISGTLALLATVFIAIGLSELLYRYLAMLVKFIRDNKYKNLK